MASEGEPPRVQAIPSMELGGFEPPTSWVRSKEVGEPEVVRTGLFAAFS